MLPELLPSPHKRQTLYINPAMAKRVCSPSVLIIVISFLPIQCRTHYSKLPQALPNSSKCSIKNIPSTVFSNCSSRVEMAANLIMKGLLARIGGLSLLTETR